MDEYALHRDVILKDLKNATFVYPTDTIYGIGCDATNEKLIDKIRKIKNTNHPFSIIIPNKEWIYKNCIVTNEAEDWIRKLPGPYTLILKLKNKKAIAKNVSFSDTIGIRMPNNWFYVVVSMLKYPIVTTSANVSGEEFMTSLDNLDRTIRNNVDYVFYEGPKKGTPSTIISLVGEDVEIRPRTEKSSNQQIKKIDFPLKEIELNK